LRIHYNVQRMVPMEETKASIVSLAELLVKQGVPKKKVCARISKMMPFSDRFTRMLLPDEYRRGWETEVTSVLRTGEAFKIPMEGISPISRYFEGKSQFAGFIARLLPPHRCYVEVFGGMGSVLLAKTRSHVEVYNDINSDLFNMFRCLQERPARCDLCRLSWRIAVTSEGT